MLKAPLNELIPECAQRTAKVLKLPLVVINNSPAFSALTPEVHDTVIAPVPNIARVEDEVAVPVQNACAVRRLLPLQPVHVPPMVTLLRLVVPVSVRPLTVGDAANTTFPDPVVPDI
jgi:hypothetical protein